MFRFHGRKLVQIYIWALSFLSKYKWEFFLVILFMLISTFIQLIIPRFVQYFIDELILEKRQDPFFMWIGELQDC
jgi:ATP-binding cassette subfamily B protein/subfamily B ATP-binding cassette protein MsbA